MSQITQYQGNATGPNEFSDLTYGLYSKAVIFDHDDMKYTNGRGGSVVLPIDAGTFVLGVAMIITEGFTGSQTFEVGVVGESGFSDDIDAFITPNMGRSGSEIRAYHSLALTGPIDGSVSGSATEDRVALGQGHYFAKAGMIAVSRTSRAAKDDPTTGEGKLLAFCVGVNPSSNWRLNASSAE